MSESTTSAQCSEWEWKVTSKAGLMTRDQGTNAFDEAVHHFAEMVRDKYRDGIDRKLADARLTDAAPELLAALRGLIRAGHSLTSASMEWNDVHAAIAKATGSAP